MARWLLGLGIAATLAANVAHGLGYGLIGAAVAAWPAVALAGSYELLMMERATELFVGRLRLTDARALCELPTRSILTRI